MFGFFVTVQTGQSKMVAFIPYPFQESNMIRFTEVVNQTEFNPRMERTAVLDFAIREVWINPAHVANLREAPGYQKLLQEGRLPADLDLQHRFTAITTMTGNIEEVYVVVGDMSTIANRLSVNQTRLLKG
jgi:hypothetical protein